MLLRYTYSSCNVCAWHRKKTCTTSTYQINCTCKYQVRMLCRLTHTVHVIIWGHINKCIQTYYKLYSILCIYIETHHVHFKHCTSYILLYAYTHKIINKQNIIHAYIYIYIYICIYVHIHKHSINIVLDTRHTSHILWALGLAVQRFRFCAIGCEAPMQAYMEIRPCFCSTSRPERCRASRNGRPNQLIPQNDGMLRSIRVWLTRYILCTSYYTAI